MPDVVHAEMSATVWKVLVVEGQEVSEGEPLVILESMKMEIPAAAEADGRIVEVLVAEGDAVVNGQPMFRME